MVVGLDKFREFFKDYLDSYVIIGGTACDILLTNEGLIPRATKDIDIILVIERLTPEFVTRLWQFIKAGGYRSLLKEPEQRKYYRFTDPADRDFPRQIELFSRIPDSIDNRESARFTRISIDEGISSLSAILMNDSYYGYTVEHSSTIDDLHRANLDALICLKAKAFLDLESRKRNGENVDEKDIKKHKNDVFRLAAMLTGDANFVLPDQIRNDLLIFLDESKDSLPDKAILREMGAGDLHIDELYEQLRKNFNISV